MIGLALVRTIYILTSVSNGLKTFLFCLVLVTYIRREIFKLVVDMLVTIYLGHEVLWYSGTLPPGTLLPRVPPLPIKFSILTANMKSRLGAYGGNGETRNG